MDFLTVGVKRGGTAGSGAFNCGQFRVVTTSVGKVALLLVSLCVFCRTCRHVLRPPTIRDVKVLIVSSVKLLMGVTTTFVLVDKSGSRGLGIQDTFLRILNSLLNSIKTVATTLLVCFFN